MKTDSSLEDAYKAFFDMIRPRAEWGGWKLWVLIGFIVLLAVMLWRGAVELRRRNRQVLRHMFHSLALEKGLDSADEDLLWQMAPQEKLLNPLLIFTSMSAFDDGVERALAHFPEEGGPERADLEERLQTLRRKLRLDEQPLGWALRRTQEISTGQRLRVGFKRDGDTRFCTCTVAEVDDRGVVVTPIVREDQEALAEVTPEETLYVRFWRRDDTEYKFRTHMHPESDPEGGMLILAHSENLDRVQRRDFFRLPVDIPMALYTVPDEETASRPPTELRPEVLQRLRLKGRLINLSAGGAALRSETALEEGEMLMIDPEIQTPFSLEGIACRVIHSSHTQEEGYTHHLEFLNVDETLRDHLVWQIDREQINLARKRT